MRYVFIKKGKFLYPAFETVHYPSHHELHGIHMISFFSNSWCSKHMGSEAGGFWVVHYRKSRTCKQLSAPSISAAANFSNTRRCSFLCWLLQAGRGLGFPICYTSARLCMLWRDWVYLQWEVPALGAPFFPAPGVWGCSEDAEHSFETWLLLYWLAQGRLQSSPVPAFPLIYHSLNLLWTWTPSDFPAGISAGRSACLGKEHCCLSPNCGWGPPLLPAVGAAALTAQPTAMK